MENIFPDIAIVFEYSKPLSTEKFGNDLAGVVSRIITDAGKNAEILNKKVNFQTSLEKIKLSNETLLLIGKITSHLVNNALVHAVETIEERISTGKNQTATIIIRFTQNNDGSILQIIDDGKGIDTNKIAEYAKQLNLLDSIQPFDQKKALEFIFSPGFSTSENISEISGRGIGLDAVKNLVSESNGKIEVDTLIGAGTTFSVFASYLTIKIAYHLVFMSFALNLYQLKFLTRLLKL